jgi:hypothetical protein
LIAAITTAPPTPTAATAQPTAIRILVRLPELSSLERPVGSRDCVTSIVGMPPRAAQADGPDGGADGRPPGR